MGEGCQGGVLASLGERKHMVCRKQIAVINTVSKDDGRMLPLCQHALDVQCGLDTTFGTVAEDKHACSNTCIVLSAPLHAATWSRHEQALQF